MSPALSKRTHRVAGWRREALRTTLWLIPTVTMVVAGVLFAVTYGIDRAAYNNDVHLATWISRDSADAARQVLIAIAAAVITVAGVVFSITILALTLASQQFGPRMLRNFIRDRGTQWTFGVLVGTFVFSVLALGSVANGGRRGDFVPQLSIAVALGLMLLSLGVLVYFIHHVATSIQLPSVVAGIAADFSTTVDEVHGEAARFGGAQPDNGMSVAEIMVRMDESGALVLARRSGFLQAVGHDRLLAIATSCGGVVRLLNRPGHFLVEGRPVAVVWPADAADSVAAALDRAHVVGASRTLTQDIAFAADQLVEIALRALSPAVNDTFTALNCIDWLGDGLCKIAGRPMPDGIYRDASGQVRLIDEVITFERLVKGAYDKVRQAGRGMPAVLIRQLENLEKNVQHATGRSQREALLRQAEMILRNSEQSVPEERDRADVRAAYETVVAAVPA